MIHILSKTFRTGLFLGILLSPFTIEAQWSKEDSGWVSLYNGSLAGMKIYFKGQGYIDNPENQDPETFFAEGEEIRVNGRGSNGLIMPDSEFSYFHVRVNYLWPEGTNIGANAGLMTHVDINSTVQADNRPRSVELNMRRDQQGSVWLAEKLGPYGSSTVNNDNEFRPENLGGTMVDFDPWGDRHWSGYYPGGVAPEKEINSWNLYEAKVYGGDSIIVIINGIVTNKVYNIRLPDGGGNAPGSPSTRGGIGLQSEGHNIMYKNFELRHLDSLTGQPLIPGCRDNAYGEFKPFRTVDDASMCLSACPDPGFVEYREVRETDNSDLCLTPLTSVGKMESNNSGRISFRPAGETLIFKVRDYSLKPIRITNLRGELVSSGMTNSRGEFSASVNKLPPGLYFIGIVSGNHFSYTRRLILSGK